MKRFVTGLALSMLIFNMASALQVESRNKNEATTVNFVLYDSNSPHRLLTDAVSEPGDCLISKNEGPQEIVEANFADEGTFYSLALTAEEMNADRIMLVIADQSAPGLWMDAAIIINTSEPAAADANILEAIAATDANLTGIIGAIGVKIDDVNAIVDSIADANGNVVLASTGLNNIPVTDPNGIADTFPEMVVQTWRRFFKKSARTPTYLYTYNDANVACTTQAWSDDGTNEIYESAE